MLSSTWSLQLGLLEGGDRALKPKVDSVAHGEQESIQVNSGREHGGAVTSSALQVKSSQEPRQLSLVPCELPVSI